MTLLKLEYFYLVAGVFLALVALQVGRDRTHPKRWGSAVFWGLLAFIFVAGDQVWAEVIGAAVLAMVGLVVAGQVGKPSSSSSSSLSSSTDEENGRGRRGGEGRGMEQARLGPNAVLWPAASLALLAAVGGWLLPKIVWGETRLVLERHGNQIGLGLACLASLALALWITRARFKTPFQEGGRILQDLGWALLLPQLLAVLGGIFTEAGVGQVVTRAAETALPTGQKLFPVLAYCLGMAFFTIVMGNAFAAFPLMTVGIGIPFIVQQHGGNPAVMGTLGMLCGYCGTLVTPMAANFNLVPAVLLNIPDKNAVIRAQWPMALALFVFNVLAMALLVYR